MKKEILIKSLYAWSTLILTVVLFYVSRFIETAMTLNIGGCSGCIPDGNGGVSCVNTCYHPNLFWVLLLGSYLVSYLITFLYKTYKVKR